MCNIICGAIVVFVAGWCIWHLAAYLWANPGLAVLGGFIVSVFCLVRRMA